MTTIVACCKDVCFLVWWRAWVKYLFRGGAMYRVARGSVFTRSILASGQEVSLAPSCRGFGITRWRQGHWEINRVSFGERGRRAWLRRGGKTPLGSGERLRNQMPRDIETLRLENLYWPARLLG